MLDAQAGGQSELLLYMETPAREEIINNVIDKTLRALRQRIANKERRFTNRRRFWLGGL